MNAMTSNVTLRLKYQADDLQDILLVRNSIQMNPLFSFMVAEFMGDFRHNAENYADDPPRIVAHFHEWMAGVGLIMTR